MGEGMEIPIAFRTPYMLTTSPGVTCWASSLRLLVTCSARKGGRKTVLGMKSEDYLTAAPLRDRRGARPPRTEMQLPVRRPQQADRVGRGPGAQPLVLRLLELPEQPGGLVELLLEHFGFCGETKHTLKNMT